MVISKTSLPIRLPCLYQPYRVGSPFATVGRDRMLPHEGGMIDNVGSLSIVVDDLHRFRGAGGITGLRKSASSEKRRKEVPGEIGRAHV